MPQNPAWAHDHIALHTSLEPQSKFLSHTVNECTRDGLVPPVLTTKIVVATINMVEIGNSKVSGDALNLLLNPSERNPVIMTLPI
jgi:hypothetical protein